MDLHDRTTQQVLEDHLQLRKQGKLEEDLQRNYAAEIVLLTETKQYSGFSGVRKSAALLRSYVPGQNYTYKVTRVHGQIGYLVWTAQAKQDEINYGADSYLIINGKIIIQTIFYHVTPK